MSFDFLVTWLAFLFSLFVVGCMLGAAFSRPFRQQVTEIVHRVAGVRLARVFKNPVIEPSTHPWQAEAVFNPAASVIDGRTHLLYRAIGSDGLSRIGYASSADGITFDERLPYPIYVSSNPRGRVGAPRMYSPVMYASGGSWGGCEDPRMVVIEDKVYVSFHVFDGWDYIRVAFITIGKADFLQKRFYKWSLPHLISPPGQIHKNWVLFPEKMHGKFAILHSLAPKIEIAYRNSIETIGTDEPFIESWAGSRRDGPRRHGVWDNIVLGSGPPPLKTSRGWLVFYHALEDADPGKYKLGALLLDLHDPTREIARAKGPVLEPDFPYENAGKPGIVYACGATIQNDHVYIYYGGADRVVCVATANLEKFLDELEKGKETVIEARELQTS